MPKFSVSAVILATFLTFSVSPAHAHNELISTSPVTDSTVEAGNIRITLHFQEAPMALPFGEGNLIAIAKSDTGEQLGPACAKTEGTDLTTSVSLSSPGQYKILWRSVSDDGHVASGDFQITVENNIAYTSEHIGNQCFDEQGKELDASKQAALSKKIEQNDGFFRSVILGSVVILLSSFAGVILLKRSQKKKAA